MKTFHFNDDYALICFDDINVNDPFLILNSKSFEKVFRSYHRTLKDEQSVLLMPLIKLTATDLLEFYKLLFKYELSTVLRRMPKVTKEHVLPIYELTENFYDYWRKFERFEGFCLETQYFPDSPNQLHFPSAISSPSQPFEHTTVYKFGVK